MPKLARLIGGSGGKTIYEAGGRRVVVPFHSGDILHPQTVKEVLEAIEDVSD